MIHRTRPDRAAVHSSGWADLGNGYEVTRVPVIDIEHTLPNGLPVFARMTYADALAFAGLIGAELIHPEHVELLHEMALRGEAIEVPPFTGTPTAERTLEHSVLHDAACWHELVEADWPKDEPATSNVGKHWVKGAPKGRSYLMGWHVPNVRAYGITSRSGPGFIQARPAPGSQGSHDDQHHDDGTTTMLVRRVGASDTEPAPPPDTKRMKPTRHTIRKGSKGADVEAWQAIIGVHIDGSFGPLTQRATERWQSVRGLVADGIVGEKSWRAAGERWELEAVSGDPRAPACIAALRDANAAWPGRIRVSDGIMGDARHQAGTSDHNLGNAVDITHDPASGCTGDVLADLAMHDSRVQYVIWDRHIWNRDRGSEGWRDYRGTNPHTKHIHISIRAAARADDRPWPWAPGSEPPPRSDG